jgi:D-glycero-alpha-D-manno-heptose-7-phosphate kinase
MHTPTIKPLDNGQIILHAIDQNQSITFQTQAQLPVNGQLDLLKGIYNRLVKDYALKPLSFQLSTFVDAPPGSGLGSSSTLVVAIIGAFVEWLKLPLGEYDIAHLAYQIERVDLKMAGGRQDQYAATFGGVNFMEFGANDKVIVNPLRIKDKWLFELENNLVLFFTETSRLSSTIIERQSNNVKSHNEKSIEAMHSLKDQALRMKEALLRGEVDLIGEILHYGWQHKKQMADGITNPTIDHIYQTAIEAGATGGKISGAGGGGFMIFYAPYLGKHHVIEALNKIGGKVMRYNFTQTGLTTWTL